MAHVEFNYSLKSFPTINFMEFANCKLQISYILLLKNLIQCIIVSFPPTFTYHKEIQNHTKIRYHQIDIY